MYFASRGMVQDVWSKMATMADDMQLGSCVLDDGQVVEVAIPF